MKWHFKEPCRSFRGLTSGVPRLRTDSMTMSMMTLNIMIIIITIIIIIIMQTFIQDFLHTYTYTYVHTVLNNSSVTHKVRCYPTLVTARKQYMRTHVLDSSHRDLYKVST